MLVCQILRGKHTVRAPAAFVVGDGQGAGIREGKEWEVEDEMLTEFCEYRCFRLM